MPRRKATTTTIETIPPDDQLKPTKLIEKRHRVEWSEIEPADDRVDTVETDGIEDDTPIIELEEQPKKKRNSERDELRRLLAKHNVTPASPLRLSIEKYRHSEASEGGTWAETEFLTKYNCTKEHIISEDYLDVASRKFGPGLYRFTLRMNNQIVTAWDKRISGVTTPIVQQINPADPSSPPPVFVQTGDGQQVAAMKEWMKAQREALKEQLEMAKLMREAFGVPTEQPAQQPDPETVFLQTIASHNDKFVEKLANGLLSQVLGKNVKEEATWQDVALELVKSGQAAAVVRELMSGLFNGFFSGGKNGQAALSPAPLQTPHMDNSQYAQQPPNETHGEMSQAQLQGAAGATQFGAHTDGESRQTIAALASPEEQALQILIDHCQRNIPANIAFERLMAYADLINEQAPQYSIDGYIKMFGAISADQALNWVKEQIPNGEAIVALSHAKEWTEQVQALIKQIRWDGEGDE